VFRVLEVGLETAASSLGGRRLIHSGHASRCRCDRRARSKAFSARTAVIERERRKLRHAGGTVHVNIEYGHAGN
jgi:hypothetical protein